MHHTWGYSLLQAPHDADLVHVEADVLVCERRVEDAEVDVLDVLEDEAGPAGRGEGRAETTRAVQATSPPPRHLLAGNCVLRLGVRVAHDVKELDDVGAAAEVLQYLDLSAPPKVVAAKDEAVGARATADETSISHTSRTS